MFQRTTLFAFSSLAVLFIACASGKDNGFVGSPVTAGSGGSVQIPAGAGGEAGAGAGGQGGSAGGSGGAAGTAGSGVVVAGQGGSPPVEDLLIYAHTDQKLFQMDPDKLDSGLLDLGAFDCVGGEGQDEAMTDVAVDSQQNLWGVSRTAVHRLELQEGKVLCKESIKLKEEGVSDARFYGLTFAPAGTIDAKKEVLVAGNTAGEMWAVGEDGAVKLLGHFGDVPANDGNGNAYTHVGKRWELSGDIVFADGKGEALGFATVRDCPNPPSTSGCNNVNTLIEIDMKKLGKAAPGSMTKSVRGQIVRRQGCDDGLDGKYGNMYGISAWNDRVYGFSRDGHLLDIATSDGTGCLIKTFDATKFSGAGVTTLAPVEAPPIK